MTEKVEPKWAHDCDKCTFLGNVSEHDLYFCEASWRPTVIARYGDDGPDYKSGMEFAACDTELKEAKSRATTAGLL